MRSHAPQSRLVRHVLVAAAVVAAALAAAPAQAGPPVVKAQPERVNGLLQDLAPVLGERFAGAYLDGAGIAHIGFAGRGAAVAARADQRLAALVAQPGVVVEQRSYNVRQLDRAMDRVARLAAVLHGRTPNGAAPFEAYVDTPANRVAVTVDPSFAGWKAAVERALAPALRAGIASVRWAETSPVAPGGCTSRGDCLPVRGGLLDTYSTDFCSTGFVVRNVIGVRFLTTAAHCGGYTSHSVSYHLVGSTVRLVDAGNVDAQVYSVTDGTMPVPGNAVYRAANNDARVISKVAAPSATLVRAPVCVEGGYTGTHCGTVTTYDAYLDNGRHGFGGTSAQACHHDSGSPVVGESDTRAFGIMYGGTYVFPSDPCFIDTYFTWISNLENQLGYTTLLTPTTETLGGGQTLFPGQYLQSADGRYKALMQTDGNFVVYSPTQAIWATNTFRAGTVATLQSDGNLVLYAPGTVAVWATNTYGHPGSVLTMQTDGNLVVIAPGTVPIWDSF